MIRINLLGDDTAIDHSAKLMLGGVVLSFVVELLVFSFLQMSVTSGITELTRQQETLDAELGKLRERTKEVRDLEKKRSDLGQKLAVIGLLKRNKMGPVRIMDDLNISVPEKAWLREVKESGGAMRIQGMALDAETIALFMKDLEASDYFVTVDLEETKQALVEGIKMQEFVLNAQVSYSGRVTVGVDTSAEVG